MELCFALFKTRAYVDMSFRLFRSEEISNTRNQGNNQTCPCHPREFFAQTSGLGISDNKKDYSFPCSTFGLGLRWYKYPFSKQSTILPSPTSSKFYWIKIHRLSGHVSEFGLPPKTGSGWTYVFLSLLTWHTPKIPEERPYVVLRSPAGLQK